MPYALREALAGFRRSPLLVGLSATMIALSLFVVGLFGVAAYNVRQVLDRIESRVEVVAYLYDDAPPPVVRAAMEQITTYPEVREVDYVSRERALEIARTELREFQTVFSALESNPLPASLNIMMQPQQQGAEAVETVARRVAEYPFVEEVRYGSEWLEKVYLLRRVAGIATLVLGIAFALVASVIIGAAIRMAIFARRDEIAIMRLVGATESFVRMPFLLEGFLTGLLGALLALGATRGVYTMMSPNVVELDWLPEPWLVAGLLAGALLGTIASAIAVRRHAGTVRG
jgi:cell division transport system permease protein